MKEREILRIISEGEGPYIEFKEILYLDDRNPSLQELEISGLHNKRQGEFAKDVMALANLSSQWGNWRYLLIGVRDDGSIKGIGPQQVDPQLIQRVLSEYCSPPVDAHYSVNSIGDKLVGLLTIPNSHLKPHQFSKDVSCTYKKNTRLLFRQGDVYLRHLKEIRKAGAQEIISIRGDADKLAHQPNRAETRQRDITHPRANLLDVLESEAPEEAKLLFAFSEKVGTLRQHARQIIDLLSVLLPDPFFEILTTEELYLLCLSAYLHEADNIPVVSKVSELETSSSESVFDGIQAWTLPFVRQIFLGLEEERLWDLPGMRPSDSGSPVRLQLLAAFFSLAHALDLFPSHQAAWWEAISPKYSISFDTATNAIWILAHPISFRQEEQIRSASELALAKLHRLQPLFRTNGILFSTLQIDIQYPEPKLDNKQIVTRNPYRRLESFTEKDTGVFFGRSTEIAQALGKVCAYDVVTVLGESGVGKTSLIRAGLIPRLEEMDYTVVYARCFDSPSQRIMEAISRLDLQNYEPNDDFITMMMRFNYQIPKGVLILDQAEELFTRVAEGQRKKFIRELSGLLSDRNFASRLVFVIREDFAHRLFDLSREIQGLYHKDHTIHLTRFNLEQARSVLSCPAEKTDFPLKIDLVGVCLDELSTAESYYPPDLQILVSLLGLQCTSNPRP